MMINLIKATGNERIEATRINNDVNGNPRYVIHFLTLDLENYESTKETRNAGLKIYRGKEYGGGFVLQSYDIQRDIQRAYNKLHNLV